MVVGTLGKALGSYGAYVLLRRSAWRKYLVNTARTLIFSTALPPPAVAGAMAALELLREQPRRVEKLQRNARVLREALPAEGLAGPARATPRSSRSSSATPTPPWPACERALERRRLRPGDPPADRARRARSRLRLAVMASHTKSELRDAGPDAGRGACRRRAPRPAPPSRGRRLRQPRRSRVACRACAASSSPAPTPASARRCVAAAICAALAARGERVAAFKPVVTGPRRAARRVAARPRAAGRASTRAGARGGGALPLRAAGVAPPRGGAGGRAIEPGAARRGGPRRRRVRWSCEGVGGLLVPLTPGYSVRDLAVDLGLPLS